MSRASQSVERDLAYWRDAVAFRAYLVEAGRASLACLGSYADTETGAALATHLEDVLRQREDLLAVATQAVRSHERELAEVAS